jgi:hypothetical protein
MVSKQLAVLLLFFGVKLAKCNFIETRRKIDFFTPFQIFRMERGVEKIHKTDILARRETLY